ncbi:MAG: hypothetical protein KatS3mg038_3561 [Candidatus Kapaibacterium sp.]|nr:MAG: hypothetical protein KatS3mg038_3561 [Candidatus Kapabacteria bacterium]
MRQAPVSEQILASYLRFNSQRPDRPHTVGTFLARRLQGTGRQLQGPLRARGFSSDWRRSRRRATSKPRPFRRRTHGLAADRLVPGLQTSRARSRGSNAAAFFLRLSALKPRPGRLAWPGKAADLPGRSWAVLATKHNPGHFMGPRPCAQRAR